MERRIEEITSILKSPDEKDKNLILKAAYFAEKAHEGQKRNSGEPYFNHLFETAKNLADMKMDATSIAAGFLHDTLEDTSVTKDTLEKEFGKEITFIVEGVTKLGNLRYHGADRHNESLRKLLLATSKDMRVVMVKLCDRLHNIKTLEFVPPEKQGRIAKETLEIYAPLAYRLGIRKLSRQLEDIAFSYADKKSYKEISDLMKESYEEKLSNLEKFRKSVTKEIAKSGFTDFHSDYRVKGVYSLYKKYLKYKKDFEKIHDMLAMRIIVPKTEDCYKVLGIIHSAWRPLPGKIKDFISFPKQNGYQSLHTTVFTGDGSIVEIQIRTEEMHKLAEYGVASHAIYKSELGDASHKKEVVSWIKNISSGEAGDIKQDFLSDRIFVFTPKGDVVDLPKEASPVDFAYSIHSDIGNKMSGVKINGKLSSIDSILHDGDIVEIVTNKNAKPNRKWLDGAKTSFAKKHIKQLI